MNEANIHVDNYGDMIAQINNLELVSYEEDGGYQGEYLAVCRDDTRLFYYTGGFGSCSGCDFLEDANDYRDSVNGKQYTITYKEALDYVQDLKPSYIVPIDRPLEFTSEEYYGFKLVILPTNKSLTVDKEK